VCLSARGGAARRDKEQHHVQPEMSEREHGGDPSVGCGLGHRVVDDPVARRAAAAPAPSSADPQFAKTKSATSAGRRRERVCLLTDRVPGGARRRRAKG